MHEQLGRLLVHGERPQVVDRRWRLLAIDGFEIDVPDSAQNAAEFGYAGSEDNRSADAWPTPGVADLVRRAQRHVEPLLSTNPPQRYETVPPERPAGERDWAIVAFVLVLLLFLGGGGALLVVTKPWARVPAPIPAAAPAPSAPSPPAVGPPREVNASLVPATIPGWTAAVCTSRNAAYDVPGDWKYSSPSLVMGFTDTDEETIVMSGVAEHGSRRCPGSDYPQPDIWSGVTGAATPVTVGDKTGSFTKTALTISGGSSCGSGRGVLYTVALPANRGESVVLVILGDDGVISDEDVRRVIGRLRFVGASLT